MSAPHERLSAEESLARDRALIESLLERQRQFPRSRTMRLLLDDRGRLGLTLAAVALLAFKPQAGLRLLRWVPAAQALLRHLR
ncbi:MAG TPA: hypothetical protein VJ764_02815 [Steroidobacteraceae bacterium]|nr:hypothetical protein [Steroidobacteraceae bacterium]